MPSAEGMTLVTAKLVMGLGCERDTAPEEVIALAEQALAHAGVSGRDVALVASLDARAEEPAIHAVARHFSVPPRFFDAAEEPAIHAVARHFSVPPSFFDAATLEAQSPRLKNPSKVVFAHTGCHGVAEGAALSGAGSDAVLLVPKIRSARATVAIAGPADFARGTLR
ncbi:cobalamin biosynthesis protein [Sinorhizobium medicae]|uniref:cobalamin biosynthesis protein n=1 Tax=Sinorhizobium medicae TaxID=110321 RepID=UPI000C7D199A|nr:cobalamin biosynthesis protein [Sinorhizobium medicae]PLU04072.1 cobalamin biosynthesis protein CobE [Sinorhizobium medicae]